MFVIRAAYSGKMPKGFFLDDDGNKYYFHSRMKVTGKYVFRNDNGDLFAAHEMWECNEYHVRLVFYAGDGAVSNM